MLEQGAAYYLKNTKYGVTSLGRYLYSKESVEIDQKGVERIVTDDYFYDERNNKTVVNPLYWRTQQEYLALRSDGKIGSLGELHEKELANAKKRGVEE